MYLVHLTLPIFDNVTFTFNLDDINSKFTEWRDNIIKSYPDFREISLEKLSFDDKWQLRTFIVDKMNWEDIAAIAEPKIPMLDDSFESCFLNEYDRIEIEFEEQD